MLTLPAAGADPVGGPGSPKRLPTIDGLIAATALIGQLTLVHRDPHLATVNDPELPQLRLPDR